MRKLLGFVGFSDDRVTVEEMREKAALPPTLNTVRHLAYLDPRRKMIAIVAWMVDQRGSAFVTCGASVSSRVFNKYLLDSCISTIDLRQYFRPSTPKEAGADAKRTGC